ncbi:hypothetical protein [Labrys wisconsinensis]|uniref:DNA-binding beta-propeller fold protein YncE n=1 Tax=Labrys wisconsinensis TaxID=425677 RepID=A0ABU0J486_9HYPH|nr:hypothetical protein [Labrys wisconsinensis]MDQ0469089.1 DNA-binding beta-propeller fold protein YncE [Labrys wisconsinensis]
MGKHRAIALALGVTLGVSGPCVADAAETDPAYAVVGEIPGAGGAWDYTVIDPGSGRLYVAQQGVTALDLNTRQLVTGLVAGGTTHGIAPLGDGRVAVTDSASKTITVFAGATGAVLARISTDHDAPTSGRHALDALVLEPKSGLLAAVSGESDVLLLADAGQARIVGTVPLGGAPEYAAADGAGTVFVNVSSGKASEIVAVDVPGRRVARRMALDGCEDPTGLAYDADDGWLISACRNGLAKVLQADSGRSVASLAVGRGADAVLLDSKRRRAFVPAGVDGTLSVIALHGASDVAVVQTLATRQGARLGAVDVATGRLYLPTAEFVPPVSPGSRPTLVPGTFKILVVAPE